MQTNSSIHFSIDGSSIFYHRDLKHKHCVIGSDLIFFKKYLYTAIRNYEDKRRGILMMAMSVYKENRGYILRRI